MSQLSIRNLLPAVLAILIPLLSLSSAEGQSKVSKVDDDFANIYGAAFTNQWSTGFILAAQPEIGFAGAEIPNIQWRKSRGGHSWEAEGSLGAQGSYFAVATQEDEETLALCIRILHNGRDITAIYLSKLAEHEDDEDATGGAPNPPVRAVIGETRCFLWLAGESKYQQTSNKAWRKAVLDLLDDVDYDFPTLIVGLEWLDSLGIWLQDTGGVGMSLGGVAMPR
jgi:hypothetical protein